jgi:hypothetical protein
LSPLLDSSALSRHLFTEQALGGDLPPLAVADPTTAAPMPVLKQGICVNADCLMSPFMETPAKNGNCITCEQPVQPLPANA